MPKLDRASAEHLSDKEWLDRVYREHHKQILDTARRRARKYGVSDPDDWAEEMTQTVFLTLCDKMESDKLRELDLILPWLFKVLRNVIGNDWKKKSNQEIPVADVARLRRSPTCEIRLDEPFPSGLSTEECRLLYLCHCQQLPRKEVAELLGISLGACQMRLERAEAHYRKLKEQEILNNSTKKDSVRAAFGAILEEGGTKDV